MINVGYYRAFVSHLKSWKSDSVLLNEFRKIWWVVILRRSPEDLAYSRTMLVLCLVLVFIGQWIAKEQSIPDASMLQWSSLIVILVLVRLVPFILLNKTARAVQSLTALFGSDLIISFPLLLALVVMDASQQSMLLSGLFLLVQTWRFIVSVFIYKCSLDLDWIKAALLVLGLSILNILCVTLVAQALEKI